MTIRNGYCDFCGRVGGLLTTGDEDSVIFYVDGEKLLWDGLCREGSKEYFKDLETPEIINLVVLSEDMLEEDPIRYTEPFDPPEVYMRKIEISAESYRARQEIAYRVGEA